MNEPPANEMPDMRTDWDVPKDRRCLRCKAKFASQWSGERVCSRCKKSKAWKRGEMASSFSTHVTR